MNKFAKFFAISIFLISCNRTNKEAAENAAREYQSHFDDATGFECADQDIDRDGYVSCTIFRRNHDPYGIECGSERYCINCARGCKTLVPKIRVGR